ncbi:MAG: PD-(D/E)XK nuclease family protein [Lachnospirales bacterium]
MFNFFISNSYTHLEEQLFLNLANIEQNKEKEAIVLTPEQFVLETNRGIAENLPKGASFFCEVHSFTSIINRYIEEYGKQKALLNEVGKKVLLQKAVFNVKDSLDFYKKIWDKVSFLDSLGSTIDEILNSKTSIETLEKLCDPSLPHNDFTLKLKDIIIIYKEFISLLNKDFIINQDILDYLSQNIGSFEFLKNKEIYLIGYNGFVKREFDFIFSLAENSNDINLFLSFDKKINLDYVKNKSYHIGDFDPYFEPKKTFYNIYTTLLEKNLLSINVYDHFNITKDLTYLNFIKENFFKNGKTLEGENFKDIYIYSTSSTIKEVEFISLKMRELIKKENLKYRDFVILCDNIEKYSNPFKEVFEPLNIPYFTDLKEPIVKDELVKYILNIFDIFLYNFNYESVFNVLKNDYCKFYNEENNFLSQTDVEVFENYVLRYNIRGTMFYKPFTYIKGAKEDKELLIKDQELLNNINQTRLTFLNAIAPFKKYYESTFLIKDFLDELFVFLEKNDIYKELNRRFNIDVTIDDKISTRASQIWQKLVDIFENIYKLLGDHTTTFLEMRKILEAGFLSNEFRYVPNNLDVVKVVDLFRSRFSSTKYLFIIGAVEGTYPSFAKSGTFFNDDDLEVFKENDLNISSDSFMQMNIQNLNIFNSIYKTTKGLYITYPATNITGEENKPSYLINRIKTLLNIDIVPFKENNFSLGEVYKSLILKEEKSLKDIAFLEKVDGYINRLNYEILNKIFHKEFTLAKIENYKDFVLKDNEYYTSISKIETYNNCPYSHFLKYDLGIYPRDEYEVDASDFGIVYHSMLESFFNHIKNENIFDLKELDKKYIETFVDTHIEEFSKGREDNILNATARYRYYVKNISNILKSSIDNYKNQFIHSDFTFSQAEVSINENIYTNEGENVKYTGYIDRVDIALTDDEAYIRTIDYKSSEKNIDINSIIAGKSLQLLKYLEVLVRKETAQKEIFQNRTIKPGGAFYLTLQDEEFDIMNIDTIGEISPFFENYRFHGILNENTTPFYKEPYSNAIIGSSRASKPKHLSSEDFDLVLEYSNFKTKNTIEKILEGKITATPISHSTKREDLNSPCDYCDYSSLCLIKERPENKGKILFVDKEEKSLTDIQREFIKKDMNK